MKNRILSLLLVLILLVTVSVFAVEANDDAVETPTEIVFPEDTANEDGDVYFTCPACGEENALWYRASVNSSGALANAKHLYVPSTSTGEDVLTTTINSNVASRTRCLWLVGDLKHSADATQAMFRLVAETAPAKLNIMGNGTITNEDDTQPIVQSRMVHSSGLNELVVWDNVTIDCSGVSTSNPGLVLNIRLDASDPAAISASTKFRMEGGIIRSPANRSAFNFTSGGYFEMNGGDIYGANAGSMGGVITLPAGSTFTMTGGTIHGGACTSAGAATINTSGSSSAKVTFNMSGGTIDGGSITRTGSSSGTGGSIYFSHCNATISGNAKILDGSVTSANNYARGGNIYATNSSVTISDNAEISGGTVTSSGGQAHGGNIFVNSSASLTITGGIIKDGIATATSSKEGNGGNVATRGTVKMSGGTIQDGSALANNTTGHGYARGGNVHVVEGTFTMTNGTIQTSENWSGRQCNRGGNVCIIDTINKTANPVFRMEGGTISGGNAGHGACVLVDDGEFYLSGGSFVRGTANNGRGVNVQSTGKITVANGFENTVDIFFADYATEAPADRVFSSTVAAASNYINGGKVFANIGGSDNRISVVGNNGNLVLAGAVTYDINKNGDNTIQKQYATAQQAVDATEGQFVQLKQPGEKFAPTKATIVDFNGQNATVTDATYLIGMDSSTDKYEDTGVAVVTIEGGYHLNNEATLTKGSKTGTRKYLALANGGADNTYSFYRYYLTIDGAGLRYTTSGGPGLIYSATFRGGEKVANAINNGGGYGIDFFYDGEKFYGEDFKNNHSVDFIGDGEEQNGLKVAFTGFMTEDGAAENNEGGYIADMKLVGKAYIKVNGETIYCSEGDENSLYDVIGIRYNSVDPAIVEMKQKYGTVFSEILEWDFAV